MHQVCRPKEKDCLAWAKFYAGGLTYYGGFLGASLAAWYLLKADRFPFWKGADMAGMVIPLGLGFGRMGCLLAGCCFGTPWNSGWALSFPPFSPASEFQYKAGLIKSPGLDSLGVHAAQLYEAFGAFALTAFLMLYLHGRKRYDGQVFVVFVAAYAALRFVLEFFRSDDRGSLLGLSTSQLIGIVMIAGAAYAHKRLRERADKLGSVKAPSPAPA
jgi:phosphatidylglycerol:prolipoprotein diacylglycerol transferase